MAFWHGKGFLHHLVIVVAMVGIVILMVISTLIVMKIIAIVMGFPSTISMAMFKS